MATSSSADSAPVRSASNVRKAWRSFARRARSSVVILLLGGVAYPNDAVIETGDDGLPILEGEPRSAARASGVVSSSSIASTRECVAPTQNSKVFSQLVAFWQQSDTHEPRARWVHKRPRGRRRG